MLNRIFCLKSNKDKNFISQLSLKTVNRSFHFLMVIFLFEAGMLTFSFLQPDNYPSDMLLMYRFMYALLALMAILLWPYFRSLSGKSKEVTRHTIWILDMCALFLGLWGARLSAMDVNLGSGFYVYLTFILIQSIALTIKPTVHLAILVFNHTFFLMGLDLLTDGTLINATAFVIFAWLVNRMIYVSEYEKYLKDKEIIRLVYSDTLTGVPNRRSFFEKGEAAFANAKATYAVILDIDHFKEINDTYGHPVGDLAIRQVALTIQDLLDGEDIFGRVGGEEFAIISRGYDDASIFALLEKVRDRVEDLAVATEEGGTIRLTISSGIARKEDSHTSLDNLLHDADAALYEAKEMGRNRVIFR